MKAHSKDDSVGLVMDAKTKEWTGSLPKGCRSVYVQWLCDDGVWRGIINGDLQHVRPLTEASVAIEKAVREGPIQFKKYRLMPVTTSDTEKGDETVASKKSKKTSVPKTKEPLVAGELRPGSFNAVLYQKLESGGQHTVDALAKLVPKCKDVSGRLAGLRKRGLPVESTEDGSKWFLTTAKKSKPTVEKKPSGKGKAKGSKKAKSKSAGEKIPPVAGAESPLTVEA